MSMKEKRALAALENLFRSAPHSSLLPGDKLVVVSDLHLGDGSCRDDFLVNSKLFLHILERHYLKNGFKLVLSGDIEELQKFPPKRIMERWKPLYDVLKVLYGEKRLFKIVGNHDYVLIHMNDENAGIPCSRALRLGYGKHTLFMFHGHQVSYLFERLNILSGFFNRCIVSRSKASAGTMSARARRTKRGSNPISCIIEGSSSGCLRERGEASRMEASTILMRSCPACSTPDAPLEKEE
jgi:hypothetical protein